MSGAVEGVSERAPQFGWPMAANFGSGGHFSAGFSRRPVRLPERPARLRERALAVPVMAADRLLAALQALLVPPPAGGASLSAAAAAAAAWARPATTAVRGLRRRAGGRARERARTVCGTRPGGGRRAARRRRRRRRGAAHIFYRAFSRSLPPAPVRRRGRPHCPRLPVGARRGRAHVVVVAPRQPPLFQLRPGAAATTFLPRARVRERRALRH